jgi:hypothetical protein
MTGWNQGIVVKKDYCKIGSKVSKKVQKFENFMRTWNLQMQ